MKKTTVSIALSVHNEAENLTQFIQSLLIQQFKGFRLVEILIINDGSTDHSVQIVNQFQTNPLIRLVNHRHRLGKSTRLNEIYRQISSDLLIQTDADVILSHPHVLQAIVNMFEENPQVMMCGGNPQPLSGVTMIEKAINHTVWAYIPLRTLVRGGDNVFSADGRILGYRKQLYQEFVIPEDTIANDAYTYLHTITKGYQYRFVDDAVVHYRSPQTLRDQVRQNTRFLAAHIRMQKIFDPDLVKAEYHIPLKIKLATTGTQFLQSPLLCLLALVINRYCYLRAKIHETGMNSLWEIATTTKKLATQLD